MLKQMKKTLSILLAVCFLMPVTAASVSAHPVVVKDKKTVIIAFQHEKTKIFKHRYHHHHYHPKPCCEPCEHMDMGMKMKMNMDMDRGTDDGY